MRKGIVLAAIAPALLVPLVTGCGGDDGQPAGQESSAFERRVEKAAKVSASDFPAASGRTLQQIADSVTGGQQLAFATAEYVTGTNRLAFGVIDERKRFVYGKSAVYLAPTPNDRAEGPFPAPADSLITKPAFRSRTAATEKDAIAAIYSTRVPLKRPGNYAVLSVTKVGSRLLGAPAEIRAKRSTPIPEPGERAPSVETDTLASAGGDIEKIDTRVPPDDMHDVSFKDVRGKRPVALLFATPQLCQTRVCGPVVDIAAQLKESYGDRVAFIHQEVYVDNEVRKGPRPPLRAFNLVRPLATPSSTKVFLTEPWLFTIDKQGRVAARLEGSFGIDEFRRALEAALR